VANALRGTRLEQYFANDDFWLSVIRWFIANPMLDTAQFGPIVDYINNQRYVDVGIVDGPRGAERRGPPQPNLKMKDRDPEVLLKQVTDWHRKLGKEKASSNYSKWEPSGYSSFTLNEGEEGSNNFKSWTITELLTHKELMSEGSDMEHCVYSYAYSCAKRHCSIWSMRCWSHGCTQRILTIEVRNNMITQARGKHNAKPEAKVVNIMSRWARQIGVGIASYL
jgi:hypothetical protein